VGISFCNDVVGTVAKHMWMFWGQENNIEGGGGEMGLIFATVSL